MIRPASFEDLPRLRALIVEMHESSRFSHLTLDKKELSATLFQFLQRNGSSNFGGSCVLVSEKDGVVEGFIVGLLTKIYDISQELMATDWMFYMSERGEPGDAMKLLDGCIDWAQSNKRVALLRFGVTDTVGNYERAGVLFRRRKFRQSGAFYEKEVER